MNITRFLTLNTKIIQIDPRPKCKTKKDLRRKHRKISSQLGVSKGFLHRIPKEITTKEKKIVN